MSATLYPQIEPYNTGFISVSELHTIYFEECGNPDGQPVVFLHGGPGGGINGNYRRYFNPEKYRIVLIDQRGCGKSTPFAELTDNTTWTLVEDIEIIKNQLKISSWAVFGGSWGSTLALAYSQKYPESVSVLFLRGIFLLRQKELHWFYQEGASFVYPDTWEKYRDAIPEVERNDYIKAYYKRLTSEDSSVRAAAAEAWSVWEASASKLIQDPSLIEKFSAGHYADAFARIECHFFSHKGFFEDENQLLNNIPTISHIPAIIVQGRYDMVCPMTSSWDLHKAWPEAKYVVVPDAGHSLSEQGISEALIAATDRFVAVGEV